MAIVRIAIRVVRTQPWPIGDDRGGVVAVVLGHRGGVRWKEQRLFTPLLVRIRIQILQILRIIPENLHTRDAEAAEETEQEDEGRLEVAEEETEDEDIWREDGVDEDDGREEDGVEGVITTAIAIRVVAGVVAEVKIGERIRILKQIGDEGEEEVIIIIQEMLVFIRKEEGEAEGMMVLATL